MGSSHLSWAQKSPSFSFFLCSLLMYSCISDKISDIIFNTPKTARVGWLTGYSGSLGDGTVLGSKVVSSFFGNWDAYDLPRFRRPSGDEMLYKRRHGVVGRVQPTAMADTTQGGRTPRRPRHGGDQRTPASAARGLINDGSGTALKKDDRGEGRR